VQKNEKMISYANKSFSFGLQKCCIFTKFDKKKEESFMVNGILPHCLRQTA